MRYSVNVYYEVEVDSSPSLTPEGNLAADIEAIESDAQNALGKAQFQPVDIPDVVVMAQYI